MQKISQQKLAVVSLYPEEAVAGERYFAGSSLTSKSLRAHSLQYFKGSMIDSKEVELHSLLNDPLTQILPSYFSFDLLAPVLATDSTISLNQMYKSASVHKENKLTKEK